MATASPTQIEEANLDLDLEYFVGKEGSNIWIDGWLMPKDAPNVENAHLFLDFLMRPDISAMVSNDQRYPSFNVPARQYLIPQVADDPAITPPPDVLARMYQRDVYDMKTRRRANRLWARFKAGL